MKPEKREEYIRVAKEEALKLIEQRGDIVAVYICGSVARGDMQEYSDVDLRVIIDTEDDPPVPNFVRKQMVPLEWSYRAKSQYADLTEVLSDPYIPLTMVESIVLYDPTNLVHDLARDIKPVYSEPRYVKARAQNLLKQPEQWLLIMRGSGDDLLQMPTYRYAWNLRAIVTIMAEVILILTSRSPGGMKLFVSLRAAAEELQNEKLFSLGLNAMGAQDITKAEVEESAADIFKAAEYVNSVVDPHDLLHRALAPDKREYYRGGTQWLVSRGFHKEAIWALLTLAPLCAAEMQETRIDNELFEKCISFLHRLGMQPLEYKKRLDILQVWLQETQAVIEKIVS